MQSLHSTVRQWIYHTTAVAKKQPRFGLKEFSNAWRAFTASENESECESDVAFWWLLENSTCYLYCSNDNNIHLVQGIVHTDWSFAEKTFVKQSMMLFAFEILLKNGRKIGGNRSSMNLSSVVGHAWVVTCERPCRYKSTNLVFIAKVKLFFHVKT